MERLDPHYQNVLRQLWKLVGSQSIVEYVRQLDAEARAEAARRSGRSR